MGKPKNRTRGEMAPAHDRERGPTKITDHIATQTAIGNGFDVRRVETVEGSRRGMVTWGIIPEGKTLSRLGELLADRFDQLQHGT